MSSLYDELFDGRKNSSPTTPGISSGSGTTSFNTTPIPLIEDDDRPAISDLINKHSSQIKKVCEILKSDPLYDPEKHDELWILRHCLSQQNTNKAAKAAKATLEFRKKYKVDELGDIRHHWVEKQRRDKKENRPPFNSVEENAFLFTIPDSNRGAINYIKFAQIDQKNLMKTMDEDRTFIQYILLCEWFFQINDEVTRRTGRLTKTLKIVDLKDANLFRQMDHTYVKRDAKMNKKLQDFYPQSLGSMLAVNAPIIFESVFVFFRPFFPKRLVEKVNVANPNKRPKDLKLLTKYVSKDSLPEEYGGKPGNELPPSII